MATQQTVWFPDGDSNKWFPTQAKALEYEQKMALSTVLAASGLNEDAAKKVAKAVLDAYTITPKPQPA